MGGSCDYRNVDGEPVRRLLALALLVLSLPALAQAQVVGSFPIPLTTALGGTNSATGATVIQGSTTLPATCTVRDVYVDTDQPTGAGLYICTATNTWTNVTSGAGVSGGAANRFTLWSGATTVTNSDAYQYSTANNSVPALTLTSQYAGKPILRTVSAAAQTADAWAHYASDGTTKNVAITAAGDILFGTDDTNTVGTASVYCNFASYSGYIACNANMSSTNFYRVNAWGSHGSAVFFRGQGAAYISGNYNGGDGLLQGAQAYGNGVNGAARMQTTYDKTTWTDRVAAPSKWTTLTESSDTAIATLTYGASTAVGAEFVVTVEGRDATNGQAMTYRVAVNSNRDASGNTASVPEIIGTPPVAAGTGTLTCTFTVTEGASAATLNANCVSSLSQTTLRATWQAQANGPVTLAQP